MKLAGSLFVFLAASGMAVASFTPAPVPEIDSSSIGTGIGLVAGASLILRARNHR